MGGWMDIKDRYEALQKKISHRKESFDKFIHFLYIIRLTS